MKKIALILLIALSFSCKKEEKKVNADIIIDTPKEEVLKDNVFKLHFTVRVSENDKFRVFYTSDSPEEKINGKKMVVTAIKGNPDYQTVSINLPVNVLPYKLRVDIGENSIKNESDIELKTIKLELNGNIIEMNNQTINDYFRPNIYSKKIELGFSRKIVDGKYDPFIVSTPKLNSKIEMEL